MCGEDDAHHRLHNYMKQLPGTIIHMVFHVYEEEGHLNCLSKDTQNQGRQRLPLKLTAAKGW